MKLSNPDFCQVKKGKELVGTLWVEEKGKGGVRETGIMAKIFARRKKLSRIAFNKLLYDK